MSDINFNMASRRLAKHIGTVEKNKKGLDDKAQARIKLDKDHKRETRVAKKYIQLYDSARNRGIQCTLSLQSLNNLYKAKRCFYTDIVLTDSTITIDRVDNDKGYVKGNVVAAHCTFNKQKGCLTVKEIKGLYRGVIKAQKRLEKIDNA